MSDYAKHRQVFFEVLNEKYRAYQNDVGPAYADDGELLTRIGATLSDCGTIRLYKYQPFSERNLIDCKSGVLHLTPVTKLNDLNEGTPIFDSEDVMNMIKGIETKSFTMPDINAYPDYLRWLMTDEIIVPFKNYITDIKESGQLENLTSKIANELEGRMRAARATQLCGSLSETVCSASMWDRYALSHSGFAAGYTVSSFVVDRVCSRDMSCGFGYKGLLAPVFYGERVDVTRLVALAAIKNPLSLYATNASLMQLVFSIYQKAREWEYEREWRVGALSCVDDTVIRADRAVRTQYCRFAPDSIYLGIKMQDDERNRVIGVAKEQGWSIYQMGQSFDSLDWSLEDSLIWEP